jgi:hypothetical protein
VVLAAQAKVIIRLGQEAMPPIFHRVAAALVVIADLAVKAQVLRLALAYTFNLLQALVMEVVVALVWQLQLVPLTMVAEVVVVLVYLVLDQLEQLVPQILHKLLLMPQWWDREVPAALMEVYRQTQQIR